jgi:hypothetical protein
LRTMSDLSLGEEFYYPLFTFQSCYLVYFSISKIKIKFILFVRILFKFSFSWAYLKKFLKT